MLDITKIEYKSKPDEFRPNCTQRMARLQIHAGVTVDNDAQVPDDVIKRQLSEHIWRMAYAELRQPFMELQTYARYARHSCQPQHYDKIRELCDKIGALLEHPNESSSATAATKRPD